jgi:hypothetical protein
MSKQSLAAVLQRIEEDIKKTSEAYRTQISNFEVHEFTINAEEIITEVTNEMKAREGKEKLSAKTNALIRKEVRKMCKVLFLKFNPKRFDPTGRKFTIVSEFTGSPTSFNFILGAKPDKRANVFNQFKRIKQVAQRPLIQALNKKLKELNRGRKEGSQAELITAQKGFLDLGHEKDSSVSLQRSKVVMDTLWKLEGNSKLSPLAKKVIGELKDKITFDLVKEDLGPPVDTIKVRMESKTINRASTSAEKQEVLELNKALKQAAEAIGEEWAFIEGSDSSVQKRQKIIVEDFVKSLRRKKNIKVKTQNTEVKKSKGKAERKGKQRKATTVAYKDKDKTRLQTSQARKGIASNPLALVTMINKELPAVVRKNMRAPGLVNRTGRFADSVEITDIMSTPKGFPSIGYTYQRDPYEVFEGGSGNPRATPERDPRILIDRSIREIAAKYAIGRFYTRRQ